MTGAAIVPRLLPPGTSGTKVANEIEAPQSAADSPTRGGHARHVGYKDFVLCLGYGGHHIKRYFLDYQETASNDFVLQGGRVERHSSDIVDWSITFVDTGLESPIGERLRRVRGLLEGEEMFLANYADVLTDAPLDAMVAQFAATPDAVGQLLAVPLQAAFHRVS